jgi:transposase
MPYKPWKLTDDEWELLHTILEDDGETASRQGRPRIGDVRSLAEACLFRYFHCLSKGRNHVFDWNALGDRFGASASTINRRFRAWHESGDFPRFHAALLKLRSSSERPRPRRPRRNTPYPVSDLGVELQRAYRFFNEVLFGDVLPEGLAITILRGKGPRRSLGYFCGRSWFWGTESPVDLIAISGLAFGRGPEVALATLIHEMVHHRNNCYGLTDCTSSGTYHNRFFRDAAILAGLTCSDCDKHFGYGHTELGDRARWAISRLKPKVTLFRMADMTTEAKGNTQLQGG